MERRKILLGSSAALTTALAGCFGSDSDDENGDDGSEPATEGGSGDDSEDNGDEDDGDVDDVPGLDSDELEFDTDAVTIEQVDHDGDTVSIVAATDVTDHEELYEELESLADDFDAVVADLDRLKDEISAIELTVDHDEMKVASFTIEVTWIADYHDEKITKDEFRDKVKSTAE
ncbi:hypothetical protein RBH26_08940 [Natronolimnohabitans sp. A-GB9]|uniref:hypothetical protein n=1 Tax=Natronolimnohabitans sp. A-GB9 TaxID=3069757 RepID=UPI0027AF7454|nr:hypothetical protein [Natronolimnohabitans sp. A-GB9]MDQ2050612.1 hypothetical protein [Natronolimnohabitans sp. A-GB9]